MTDTPEPLQADIVAKLRHLLLPGLLPAELAEKHYPYKPPRHREWVESLLLHSDATAQRLATREAILAARRERPYTVRILHMPTIYEVGPDGVAREVSAPAAPASELAGFRTGLAIGAGATLLALAVQALLQSRQAQRRRRG